MKFLGIFILALALAGIIFFAFSPRQIAIRGAASLAAPDPSASPAGSAELSVPEAPLSSSSPASSAAKPQDLPPQPPLANPPAVVKGIYLTAWTAGSPARVNSLIALIKRTELNAVVIDVKDYSGYVSYAMDVPEAKASGAENQIRIAEPNRLIKLLHDNGIYVIGRITVFQDPVLAKAHPEWAMEDLRTGKTWKDKSGLAWLDPAAKPVWDYVVSIAKDALLRGFDEINFDYVRFASDGSLSEIKFPFWDGKTPRRQVIGSFFKYLRDNLPDAKISADVFGLTTVDTWDDLGIGQVIEEAYKYFDYVCPMVYPSHYASGFMGYKNPADYPYEVVKYSMEKALARLAAFAKGGQVSSASSTAASSSAAAPPAPERRHAALRPWLQDFDLGANYTAPMVDKEFQAVSETLGASTSSGVYGGWLLWSPTNIYTEGALQARN